MTQEQTSSGVSGAFIEKILVVEDEYLIRSILVETLQDRGFDTVEASCGDEAISLLADPAQFAAVITDVQMPGTNDGIAVGQHIRSHDPAVPVIYVTGRPESLTGLAALGPSDVLLRKPYGLRDIVSVVEGMIRHRRGF